MVLTLKFKIMDKLFMIHLELTYKDITGVLSVTDMHYCSPNQNISLLGVVGEPQFAMAVDKTREKAHLPCSCCLVGVRELPDDANLL